MNLRAWSVPCLHVPYCPTLHGTTRYPTLCSLALKKYKQIKRLHFAPFLSITFKTLASDKEWTEISVIVD